VAVEVVGYGTTTVTLDLAAGNRILAEETITGTTLYLYPSARLGASGRDCLGEFRDGEALYYLPDAEGLVRQGTDAQGDLVSAWLFDPDGALLEGPDGPVSHLVCGGVYDQSTGLLYKGGRYFDPSLGIWLALLPLLVVRRKKKRRGYPWVMVLALCLGGMSGVLTACGGGGKASREFLESICIDVPSPGDIELSVEINAQPTVQYEGKEQFIRLGEAARDESIGAWDPNRVGARVVGRMTSASDNEESGEFKFRQFIASTRRYYFEVWDSGTLVKTSDMPVTTGGLNKWYVDTAWGQGVNDPIADTLPGSCNNGETFWGYMGDSPGQSLQWAKPGRIEEKDLPVPLVAKFEREDKFKTYLLWYPTGSPEGIPIAMVEWGWSVTAMAEPNPGVDQWYYPLKWTVTEPTNTDPPVGTPRLATEIDAQGLDYAPTQPGRWQDDEFSNKHVIFWTSIMNKGR